MSTNDASSEGTCTLTLLIDGDNASPKIISGLLAEIANYGRASVKRIYGDWTRPNLGGWKKCLLEHAIQPIQQFAYTSGKGATDGAMIIDAMDLLYTGRFDGFCIVSSDCDFAGLASRIRQQGVTVYGFGARKTPRPFITACDKFVFVDVLQAPEEKVSANRAAPGKAKAKATKHVRDKTLLAMLRSAVESASDETGWANLAAVGSLVAKQAPEFDCRNYGFPRLSELVKATGEFETKPSGKTQKVVLVCAKSK